MAKIIYLYTLFVKGDFHKIFRWERGRAAVPPLPCGPAARLPIYVGKSPTPPFAGALRPPRLPGLRRGRFPSFPEAHAGGWKSVVFRGSTFGPPAAAPPERPCGPPPVNGGAPPPGPPGELFLWRKSSQKAREGRLASLPNPSTRGQPRDPARGVSLDPQFPEAFLFSGQGSVFPVLPRGTARHSSWRSTRRQYASDMRLHPHTRMATEPRPSRRELVSREKRGRSFAGHVPALYSEEYG